MTKVKDLEAKLEQLIQKLKSYQEKGNATLKDVEKIQDQLHELDEQYQDGAIKEADGSIAPGQGEFADILNEAHDLVADLLSSFPDEDD